MIGRIVAAALVLLHIEQFADATVRATNDRSPAQNLTGQSAAISVGQQVERPDSADLQKALNGLSAAAVTQAFAGRLVAAPDRVHHLGGR